jgi:hypothetical protein
MTFDTQARAIRCIAGRRVKPTETTAMQIYRSQSAHEAAVGLFHRERAAGGFLLHL